MGARKSVLFVCTGNTCRSPMAEAMFRQAVAGRGDYEVGSAGVSAGMGASINAEAEAVLRARGISSRGFRSRPVSDELLAQATHVFAMTEGHLGMLEHLFPEYEDKFYLMCEFVDLPGQGIGADVADPLGMGPRAYLEVARTFELAIPTLVKFIDQTAGMR